MQYWFLPLILIKLLALSGLLVSLLGLRARFSKSDEFEIDRGYGLLIAFSLIAVLSMGLFILILSSTLTW